MKENSLCCDAKIVNSFCTQCKEHSNDYSVLQEEAADDLGEALDLVAYAWGLDETFKERVVNFVENIIKLDEKEKNEN